ncbi:MAG: GreA/GreB family elongation factor [Planctomycetota bacterium]|nr:GreA/GreB family elongation factor [Planctomycetota bacterium]MDG2144415.1 GreA/GreB family elongation factor [Planctomycetota bacterium]
MTLLSLFSKKRWLDLDDAWTEHMLVEGHEIEPILALLQAARERKEVSRLMMMIREHANNLLAADRFEDAASVIGAALLGGGNPGELSDLLFKACKGAWSGKDWWDAYVETTGFHEGCSDVRGSWEAFATLKAFEEGAVIFHPSGWGLGQVTSVNVEEREINIKFANGRPDHFPFSTAVDIFDVLHPDDLRGLVLLDPDKLAAMIKDEPLIVLRTILERHHGRLHVPILRNAMAQLGKTGPGFTAWWRKCRKEAEKSEWFEVIGTATKAQVRLLATAADPAESMRKQLLRSATLHDALVRVRDLFSGKSVEENLAKVGLEVLGELAEEGEAPINHRLGAWMLIRENSEGTTPAPLVEMLVDALEEEAEGGEIPALWSLFNHFDSIRDQERCVGLLQETVSDDGWLDEAAINLKHAPAGMVKPLIEALLKAKRLDELAKHFRGLLARPMRNPQAFVALAELVEKGKVSKGESTSPQRLHAMLQMASYFKNDVGASSPEARAHKKLINLLVNGEPSLVKSLCTDSDIEALRTAHLIVERGVDVMLDRTFTHVIAELAPEIFKAGERPFWESGNLWTTQVGLSDRKAELRELIDVKIPNNAEAIGKAASFGDLSENSEWDAALEEQRNLTGRAQEIETEVAKAALLDSATIPENTVAPGTEVQYLELESGEKKTVRILGPWDTKDADTISYQSPLAKGMLGVHPGSSATLELPSGELEIEVISVSVIELGVTS